MKIIKRFIHKVFSTKSIPLAIDICFIIFLFALPYYLFQGRLFLGGDDTRLHYVYSFNFLKDLSFFSWDNISSLPSYLPNHHSLPLLTIFTLLNSLVRIKVAVFYFAFSLPFVLGFVYFEKLIKEFIPKEWIISLICSLIYILSPITVISQMFNFLFSMYLVALIPILAYYYVAYIRRGNKTDIYKVVIYSIAFSIAFYAIQWIAAVLLPFLM